jgi:hypothetical protein
VEAGAVVAAAGLEVPAGVAGNEIVSVRFEDFRSVESDSC